MDQYTKPDATDDSRFLSSVESLIQGVDDQFATDCTYVVKIDSWFGKRWLRFSGKDLGGIGVRKDKLTLPPFVPSRVVWQHRLRRSAAVPRRHRRLHMWQRSVDNLQRYAEVTLQGSSVFWFSGHSATNDRASFMAYVYTRDGHWPWYVGVQRTDEWRVIESLGIAPTELAGFLTGSRARRETQTDR